MVAQSVSSYNAVYHGSQTTSKALTTAAIGYKHLSVRIVNNIIITQFTNLAFALLVGFTTCFS